MKNKNIQLKRLSLALLGGAALASPEAFAAGSTQTCDTSTERGTVTKTCSAEPATSGESYTFLTETIGDEGAFVFETNGRDHEIEAIEFTNSGASPAALGGNFEAGAQKSVTFNLGAHTTISSTDGNVETNALLVKTHGGDPNATYNEVTATIINTDSTISVRNTANGDAVAIHVVSDNVSSNRVTTVDEARVTAEVTGKGKAYGVLIDSSKTGNNQNNFKGTILADGHNQGLLSVGVSSTNLDSLSGTGKYANITEAHYNTDVSRGSSVEAKNSDYNIAVAAAKGVEVKGNISLHLNEATIKASGGKELNVGVLAGNIASLDNFAAQVSTNQNVKENAVNYRLDGSIITVDGTTTETPAQGQGSKSFGLVAVSNFEGESSYGTDVRISNRSSINVLNTQDNSGKANSHLNAGVYSKGPYALVDLSKDSNIKVTGEYNTGIYAESTGVDKFRGRFVHLDIEGKVEATNYGLYTKTKANQTTVIDLSSDAQVYADTAIYNNEGDSKITILSADIGKEGHKTNIELNEGYDFLTFNGTKLKYLNVVDGGEGTDVNTNFDSLTIENITYDNITGDIFKNWEHVKVKQGHYKLSGDITVGHGIHPANLEYIGGLEIVNADLGVVNRDITITGDVLNRNTGTLNLRLENGEYARVTVDGDYYGGGNLEFNTSLGDDNSQSDRLIIKGNVYGQSRVIVYNTDGTGAQTDKGIQLIKLGANSKVADKAFTLVEKKEAGDYEYSTLAYKEGADNGIYLLSHKIGTPEPTTTTSTENSSSLAVVKATSDLNLDGYEYLRALRSNTALTAFNGTDLFFDHKNDQGFTTNFASRYATNQGYYSQLTLSYGNAQYRVSGSVNYGKDAWENFYNTNKSLSKTLGFTGEVAYHHADDFIFALNLDYGRHDNQIKRSYKVKGKTNTFSNNMVNNSVTASLRLAKDFNFSSSSLTPYFALAVQNNLVKGFNENLNQTDTTAGTYDKLVLEAPSKTYTSVRPEVGLLGSARLTDVFEVKGGVSYSYLPETTLNSVLVGSKAGKEVFRVAQDFNYKEDHLIAGRLALVAHFGKNLSLKVEGKANKLSSVKGVKASGELALKYSF